jgi:hypothetical protein
MGTVTQLPVRKPQTPPDPAPEAASYLSVVYDMGLAEGERRAYAALGIPQPPRSGAAVLTLGPAS